MPANKTAKIMHEEKGASRLDAGRKDRYSECECGENGEEEGEGVCESKGESRDTGECEGEC